MSVFAILGAYFAFAGFIMYVLIMGQSRFHRDGYVGALSRWIQNLPSKIFRLTCIAVSCGNKEKGEARWSRCEHGVMMKRHPTLQIFYLGIMAAAYWAFFTFVFPRLPVDGSARIVSVVMSIAAIGIFIGTSFTDPGIVPTKAQRQKMTAAQLKEVQRRDDMYAGDGVMFPVPADNQDCPTCAVPKPARSKHCRVCNLCVRRYDHHCGWMNQDIGHGNMIWFHAFLVFHVLISMYYCALSVVVLLSWATREGLWGATYIGNDGRRHVASNYVLFMYTLTHNPAIVALIFFAALVAVMLFVFWISHFKNAMRNLTSNEMCKLDDYTDLLTEDLRARRQRAVRGEAEPGDAEARPRDEQDIKVMVREAEAGYSLGSWWLNVADAYGLVRDPKARRATWLNKRGGGDRRGPSPAAARRESAKRK